MSDSQARASRSIDEFARRFDALAEIRITDGAQFDKIDAALQKRLCFRQETEVRIRSIAERQILELDEQVDLTGPLIEVIPGRRAEHVETPDSVLPAQRGEPLPIPFKHVRHGGDDRPVEREPGDVLQTLPRRSIYVRKARKVI